MKFKFNPIQQTGLFLMIYSAAAIGFNWSNIDRIAWHLATTLGFGLLLFFIYSKLFKKKKMLWNTIITSLIIFLILHYPTSDILLSDLSTLKPLLYPLIATFFAITGKFFFEWKGLPFFNPVAISLLFLALIMKFWPDMSIPFISWWGAAFKGYISLGLMAIWIVLGLRKWRKYPAFFSFLIAYAVTFIILMVPNLRFDLPWEALQFTYTDATIYFMAGIMLIEPKTSPLKKSHQIGYGAVGGVLNIILIFMTITYPLLWTIVGANVFNLGIRWWMLRPKK